MDQQYFCSSALDRMLEGDTQQDDSGGK